MKTARTIMIMAGGTGGHIFPALAVAEYLQQQGWRVVWLGSRKGMEAKIVAERGYRMAWLSFSGVRGKGYARLLWLPMQLLRAFWQSAAALFRHRPEVVLGMGGYIAFPGGMMASLLNKPLVVHEQNSIAGLTNRVLAAVADKVLTAFPDPFDGASESGAAHSRGRFLAAVLRPKSFEIVGNPIRAEIAAVAPPEQRFAGREGALQLLVLGGSLGAQALNATVPRALALIPAAERPSVTHQSGAKHIEELRRQYSLAQVDAKLVPFIDDMAACYARSDLVLCRAGAITIAELAAAGVASVLVPFPHAVDDHQTRNARYLVEHGAAILLAQAELSAPKLAALLRAVDRGSLLDMAQRARALARPDATQKVAQACMKLAA